MFNRLLRRKRKVTPVPFTEAPSTTRSLRVPEPPAPVIVDDEATKRFLERAAHRATTLRDGSVFTLQFAEGDPQIPAQVVRLVCLVQRHSRSTGLKFVNCNGWEFKFVKLASVPQPVLAP